MAKDNTDNVDENSLFFKMGESEKSFVRKVRSRVSGLFNSSISRLFGYPEEEKSSVKRHEEDEESCSSQPPAKRIRLPSESDSLSSASNHVDANSDEVAREDPNTLSNDNTVTKTFNCFPEPVAGPSKIKSRKLITNSIDKVSCTTQELTTRAEKDSDSGDSTSGYSSVVRAANKDSQETKKSTSTPINHKSIFNTTASTNRSLFMDRSLSPQINSSLSSRRPSFNITTFGSPDFIDKTVSTKRIMDSPFYKGRTIYGGASTYSHKLGRSPSDMKVSIKESIRIKPSNDKSTEVTSLSKTAQRILSTLEQYATPVRDVKKIPISPRNMRQNDTGSKYVGARPYTIHERKKPSTKELQVPTVPELLKMKERLQDSTVSVRQIADSSKSMLNNEYTLRTLDNDKDKHSNKMRTKVSSTRQKTTSYEPSESVKLPSVALPITTLPKFDFTFTAPIKSSNLHSNPSPKTADPIQHVPSSSTAVVSSESPSKSIETEKKSIQKETINSIEYKFSKPLVIAENLRSIIAINNFRFSKPVSKKQDELDANNETVRNDSKSSEPKVLDIDSKSKNNGEFVKKISHTVTPSAVLDTFHTMKDDNLLNKFKPPEGTWECSVCLIRNQPDKIYCIACTTPKTTNQSSKDSQTKSSIRHSNKWECPSCRAPNNLSDDKCLACHTEKPKSQNDAKDGKVSEAWECYKCLKKNKIEFTKCETCQTLKPKEDTTKQLNDNASLSVMFKPAPDTWECSVCMIRNKDDKTKCSACDAPKAKNVSTDKGFMDIKFKPPSNTWECPTCMIRNSDDKQKCAACETVKPNCNPDSKKSSFGGAHNKKSDDWECPSCMVKNSSISTKCVCCETPKIGEVKSGSSGKLESTFNFGIDNSGVCPFKFGIPATVTNITNTDSSTTTTVTSNNKTDITHAPSFVFGATVSSELQKPATSVGFSFGNASNQVGNVTFGITPSSNGNASSQVGNVTFGITPSSNGNASSQVANVTFGISPSSNSNASSQVGNVTFGITPSSNIEKIQKTSKVTSTSNVVDQTSTFANKELKNTSALHPSLANGEIATSSSLNLKNSTVSSETKPLLNVGTSNVPSLPNVNFNSVPKTTTVASTTANVSANKELQATKSLFKFGASQSEPKENTNSAELNCFQSASALIPNKQADLNSNTTKQTDGVNFKFGSDEPPNKMPFSFSTSVTTNTDSSKTNTFSFTSSQTAGTTGGFNFTGTSAPATEFTFGSKADASGSNLFGSTSFTSKNGGFNFGTIASANTTQKAGFSFGAAAAPRAQTPSTGGFNFVGSAPAPATGGFNFSAPDPSMKPSFNFTATSAMPVFSAQPTTDSGSSAAPRKMKRAVRRTTPR